MISLNRFDKYAWFGLIVRIGGIIWWAYIRLTGFGAGVGSHWFAGLVILLLLALN